MSQNIQILLFIALLLVAGKPAFASECPKGEYWVNPHFRRAYVRYDGTEVRATNVRGYCKENPRGYEKWHQKLSNERPGFWGYKSEKSKKWSVEEAERVYEALSVLPQQLLDLDKVKIHRMIEHVSNRDNPATTNYDDVVLYDSAFKHKVPLEQILAHELSHSLYNKLTKYQKKIFATSAKWEEAKSSGKWVATKEKIFFEQDSKASLEEDFANHIEYYLFKGQFLKKSSPEAHKWIGETFGVGFKLQEKK